MTSPASPGSPSTGPGLRIREATPEDAAELQAIQARAPQGVSVQICAVNTPDFFGRVRLQRDWVVLVACDEGRVLGSAASVFKDALVDGVTRRVAYVLQVFTDPSLRRRGIARALLGALEDEARARGAALTYMLVLRGNTPMEHVIGSLGYRNHRRIVQANVLVYGRPRPAPPSVRRATPGDVDAITALLASTWRGYQLWAPVTAERVAELVAGAPHMRPLLVHERAGRVVACASALDLTGIIRNEVRGLGAGLNALRAGLDVGRRFFTLPRVPSQGDLLRMWMLTPLGCEHPRDLRPVVDVIYDEARAAGVEQLSSLRERGHPMNGAWRWRIDAPVEFGLHYRPLDPSVSLGPGPVAIPGEDIWRVQATYLAWLAYDDPTSS